MTRSLALSGVISIALLAVPNARSQNGAAQAPPTVPTISAANAAGSRLWILLFDTSSIRTDDAPRARASALRWIESTMKGEDLVAIETVGSTLKLAQNFTSDVQKLQAAVNAITAPADGRDTDPNLVEQDFFNNDLRLRGLRTLCLGLRPIEKKKAILFFTAGHERPGADNEIETRAAVDACGQANTSINPVDVRDPRGGVPR